MFAEDSCTCPSTVAGCFDIGVEAGIKLDNSIVDITKILMTYDIAEA